MGFKHGAANNEGWSEILRIGLTPHFSDEVSHLRQLHSSIHYFEASPPSSRG